MTVPPPFQRASWLIILALTAGGCPDPLGAPVARITVEPAAPHAAACGTPAEEVSAALGEAAPLFAHCSYDPNGLTLTYHWALVDQPSGSLLTLPTPGVKSPSLFPDLPGSYELSRIVSNGVLTSAPAFVRVIAE
jgi:hypothetical protein